MIEHKTIANDEEYLRQIAKTVTAMAEAEGLSAHANAVELRIKN